LGKPAFGSDVVDVRGTDQGDQHVAVQEVDGVTGVRGHCRHRAQASSSSVGAGANVLVFSRFEIA
jgi:hypothetical protein